MAWQPDEDRLLAFAFGLEHDPELEAAIAQDEELRRRVDELRADVVEVARQIERAVPQPAASYADVHDQRWATLHPYVSARPQRPKWTTSLWARILAPAAAVVLLAVVGVVALQQQNDLQTSVGEKTGPEVATPSRAGDGSEGRVAFDRDALRHYAVVLVARASSVHDGFQRFDVERVLRGSAPAVLRLRVRARPAQTGVLHVLYLAPVSFSAEDPSPVPSSSSPAPQDSASPPEGLPSGTPPSADTSPPVVEILFADDGDTALAVPLPADVEAGQISLP